MSHKNNFKFSVYLRDFLFFLHQPDFRRGSGRTRPLNPSQSSAHQYAAVSADPGQPGPDDSVRRTTGKTPAWRQDWLPQMPWKVFFCTVLVIWLINYVAILPLVDWAYQDSGADFQMEITPFILLLAVIWAPLSEEVVFRYWLRRPFLSCWWLPASALLFFVGLSLQGIILVAFLLTAAWCWIPRSQNLRPTAATFKWGRRYRRHFFWVMHLSVLVFAMLHLYNYSRIEDASLLVLVMLILPQWFVGLCLAWVRMRYGIFQSMCLHLAYNSVPAILSVLALATGTGPEGF